MQIEREGESNCASRNIGKRLRFLAFTLSEALLTMTILGVIAAIMVTMIRPHKYREEAFNTLKKRTYATLDEALILL